MKKNPTQEEHSPTAHSGVSSSSPARLNLLCTEGCPRAPSPAVQTGVPCALGLQMTCNRDTEARLGKGSARLDVYPPMAKKARDPRELFVNLNGSNILDEVPPEESALWAITKSAKLMVNL